MHKPVLLQEVVDGLDLKDTDIFVDGTYGAGGHTKEVLKRCPKVKAISIDQDPATQADIIGNFRDIDKLLEDVKPDAILFDLGFSSDQLVGKGLSFQRDEPLDMRLSRPLTPEPARHLPEAEPMAGGRSDGEQAGQGITAAEILNSWDEHAIELILRGFGEERYSKRIAREIVERREVKPFQTTFDLVEAVLAVKPKSWREKIHPATKTFQALRIAVNEELTALEEGLDKGFQALKSGGRFAVITFHSLEDRIVKNFFRDKARLGNARLINKKPITPSPDELRENPRGRSAKLRIIEKI